MSNKVGSEEEGPPAHVPGPTVPPHVVKCLITIRRRNERKRKKVVAEARPMERRIGKRAETILQQCPGIGNAMEDTHRAAE